jgi:hypothetical protein
MHKSPGKDLLEELRTLADTDPEVEDDLWHIPGPQGATSHRGNCLGKAAVGRCAVVPLHLNNAPGRELA